MLRHIGPALLGQTLVQQHTCQLVSEIYGITRSRQGTDARVEQIGRPSLVHRHHRNARGQGFQNGEAEGLVTARQGQDVGSGIEFRQAFTEYHVGYAATISVMLLVISIGASMLFVRLFGTGSRAGGERTI